MSPVPLLVAAVPAAFSVGKGRLTPSPRQRLLQEVVARALLWLQTIFSTTVRLVRIITFTETAAHVKVTSGDGGDRRGGLLRRMHVVVRVVGKVLTRSCSNRYNNYIDPSDSRMKSLIYICIKYKTREEGTDRKGKDCTEQ